MKKLLAFAILACSLAISSAADAKPKIGILGLQPIDDGGGDDRLNYAASAVTSALREVAAKAKPINYEVPESAFEDFLASKILYNCTSEKDDCLADLGKQLGVDVLLFGKIERFAGKGYQVRIKRFDVKRGSEDGRATEIIPFRDTNEPTETRKWATVLWNEVLARRQSGTLRIRTNTVDGTVFVDNKISGRVVDGVARLPLIKAGERQVRVESEGNSASKSVMVTKGEESTLELNIGKAVIGGGGEGPGAGGGGGGGTGGPVDDGGNPKTKWKVLFGLGLVATSGMTGYALWRGVKKRDDAANAALDEELPKPASGNCSDANSMDHTTFKLKCDEANDLAKEGRLLGVVAGGLGVVTAVFAYMAFSGDDEADDDEEGIAPYRRKRKAPVVRWAPIGPGDVGASLEVTF